MRIFAKYCYAIFVNNHLDAQFFYVYVYLYSLRVLGSHVPIIRRINCINTTSGMSLCIDGRLVCRFLHLHASHLYRVTYTRCRIDTINFPDDGHIWKKLLRSLKIIRHREQMV
jgi:hypothetical protein